MKKNLLPIKFVIAFAAIALMFTACAAFRNGAPPTAVESKFFNVQTNYTPIISVQTNVIPVTLYQTNIVTQSVTNPVGVIEWHTNIVTIPVLSYQTNTMIVTNQEAHYSYTPNTTTTGVEGVIGAIPVYGTLASTALAGLAAIWGWFRSSKQGAAGATLAQGIETMREFVKQLPNGTVYDAALTQWLQQHQADTNTLNTVLGYLENTVSNSDAQIAAQQVRAAIAALNPSAVPPVQPAKA
jgi:hypothetical protein